MKTFRLLMVPFFIFSVAVIACDDDSGSKTEVPPTVEGAPLSVFAASNANGRELWITDGTEVGTTPVLDINPGANSGLSPDARNEFGYLNGKAYFKATNIDDPAPANRVGSELWVTDGTTQGTTVVRDIYAGAANNSDPRGFSLFNNRLYFAATTADGRELWRTDGTEAGTVKVQTGIFLADNNDKMTVFNDRLYFAGEGAHGMELWSVDKNNVASELYITVSTEDSNPENLTAMGDMLFFTAETVAEGRELYVTDGTSTPTMLAIDTNESSSVPGGLAVYNGKVYFAADDGVLGLELWCSDGTGAGTKCAADINDGSGDSSPGDLTPFNGRLYFSALAAGQRRLYVFDSTTGTAGEIRMTYGTYTAYSPQYLAVFDYNIYFRASIGVLGADLWMSDGTAEGTRLVEEINTTAEPSDSNPWLFTAMEDRLYFCADDGNSGNELWTTDGTVDGTFPVRDIYSGGDSWPFGVGF